MALVAPAGSAVRVFNLSGSIDSVVTGTTQTFGPYTATRNLHMKCTAGAVSWTQPSQVEPTAVNMIVSPNAPDNNDGRPDGTVYIQSAS